MTSLKPRNTSLQDRLVGCLEPWRDAPSWCVAFSGGLDSTVLLHLLVELSKSHSLPELRALHVHHGLQVVADTWPSHCQAVCEALGVPLEVIRVRVQPGASLERAAREARYLAFVSAMSTNEVMLTGQHRDDQAETLLFRLLRGAGVRGLAAMPMQRALGAGHLVRPLLDVLRTDLEDYAREHDLRWIEDPSNADCGFSRNYLRHQVFPALTRRWPQAVANMARSAEHFSEAQSLLEELAEEDLHGARSSGSFSWLGLPSLELAPLLALSAARQRNALRHWLAPLTRLPDSEHWASWDSLRDAVSDAHPVWRLADGELYRAGGRLWWLSGDWLCQPGATLPWADSTTPLNLPGNGQVCLAGAPPMNSLEVRYRHGGEVMDVPGRGHRDLKRLLNESGLPGFARVRLPLLFHEGRLLAVANLPGLNTAVAQHWKFHWVPPTNDQGLS